MSESGKSRERSIGQRMGVAALLLSASILISRVLGFLRDVIVTTTHGAGIASDAYYAAFTLPEIMNYFLAGGTLSITFIPLFSSYVTRGKEEEGWELFSTIATVIGVVLILVTLFAGVCAPAIIPKLFPGFTDPEQLELTVLMTRIVLPAQLAFYIGGLVQATLFVRETFWPSAISPLVYNGCIILGGVLLEPWLGIAGFSVGVLVGALLGPLAIPLWVARRDVRYRPRFDIKSPGFIEFIKLTLPLMLGATLVTVDEWLLKVFGSMHEDGAITWLNHSRKLMMVLFAVIGQAAGQAALPYLSKLYGEGKTEEMGDMMAASLQRVVFLTVIAAVGLGVVAEPLVYFLYHRGGFGVEDANQTTMLLVLFCFGMTSWASQSLAVRGFYARKDTLTPMIIGSVVLALTLPVYYVLDQTFGVAGLAAATSVGITMNVVGTVVVYRRKSGYLPLRGVVVSFVRALVFAVLCAAAGYGSKLLALNWLNVEKFWEAFGVLVSASAGFGGVALVLFVLARPPEVEVFVGKVMRKLRLSRA